MLIIGERINGTRKAVGEAVKSRNADVIRREAEKQLEAGAVYLDVNAGTTGEREVEDMEWLVRTVREVTDAPLCIDSPNPEALRVGLKEAGGPAIVNSITAQEERYASIVPVVKEFDAAVICILMDDQGMHHDVDGRFAIAVRMVERLGADGISPDRIYFDPAVRPVATEPDQGKAGVELVRRIMGELEGVHTTCGLSNISFGLPERAWLNATYLAMLMGAGLDCAIADPTNRKLRSVLLAAKAILGEDTMCMEYIQAAREGVLS